MSAERILRSKTSPGQEVTERVRIRAIPSWENTLGTLELRTHNTSRLHSLLINNTAYLKDYYEDVYFAVISGEKPPKPDVKDLIDGPTNRIFSTHFRIIRETVTGTIERPSRGWAKHVAREKAAARKI